MAELAISEPVKGVVTDFVLAVSLGQNTLRIRRVPGLNQVTGNDGLSVLIARAQRAGLSLKDYNAAVGLLIAEFDRQAQAQFEISRCEICDGVEYACRQVKDPHDPVGFMFPVSWS